MGLNDVKTQIDPFQGVDLYKAREDSLHESANMISSAKLEKALEIAKNMMSSGLDIVTISKFIQIPVDELKRHLKLQ